MIVNDTHVLGHESAGVVGLALGVRVAGLGVVAFLWLERAR